MYRLKLKSAQVVTEYILLMSVVLSAVLSIGFIDRFIDRKEKHGKDGIFTTYFNKAAGKIAGGH
jgi:cytosine/uracil/thiamine/allantoin permease